MWTREWVKWNTYLALTNSNFGPTVGDLQGNSRQDSEQLKGIMVFYLIAESQGPFADQQQCT